jgi:hypothetical protein
MSVPELVQISQTNCSCPSPVGGPVYQFWHVTEWELKEIMRRTIQLSVLSKYPDSYTQADLDGLISLLPWNNDISYTETQKLYFYKVIFQSNYLD